MHTDTELKQLLIRSGFDEKAARIYLALLASGPSPVRRVADAIGVNRGTTHTLLRDLVAQGVVSYYHKQKRKYFVAEDPEKVLTLLQDKIADFQKTYRELESRIPMLHSLYGQAVAKTSVRSYEGRHGVRIVLEDVLSEMRRSSEKLYRVYSSVAVRDALHRCFPSFTKERIKHNIFVRVIAIGAGGEYQEHADRRWLPAERGTPTYRILYAGNVVHISKSEHADELHAFVIRDNEIYKTEVIIFDQLWTALDPHSS
ncbi:helix-turn-helix domain-containing protein [Candidatus Uhrbacteria bacterium]|nr:helix-turn-helix domain-containing protein [Candidatus Uhrbacteria bacterium]